MMRQYPKRIKRLIREYAAIACAKESDLELEKLSKSFEEWRRGEINSDELRDRIHKFTEGPSKEMEVKYDEAVLDMTVAYAIVTGLLDEKEMPVELIEHLGNAIYFYEQMK